MQSASPPAASPRRIGLAELFTGFLSLGLMSFGGALPFARRTIVEELKWLSADEFTDLLGLCQFLPGGNVINLSVAVGMRFRGVAGAFAGILGLIAGPTLVVVALGVLYAKTQNDPRVQHLFTGLAAAAAGLLVAMAVKVAKPLRHARAAAGIAALAFVAIAVLRIPLLTAMLVLTPVSIWLASRRRDAPAPQPAPAAARDTQHGGRP
ncbi:chromate transporter [Burkholderia metallica]|uniref:chromate transporter n=1 Tax=Burkholderia metallica TaxID=488729 RepID=UPI0014539142|nr:chromate transporter [Burkholderia metallica]VWC32935.1 chromate transporter [Burkholderia metallica]